MPHCTPTSVSRGGSITTAKIAWSAEDGAEIRTATDLESSVPLTRPLRIVGTTIAAMAEDGSALYTIPAAGDELAGQRKAPDMSLIRSRKLLACHEMLHEWAPVAALSEGQGSIVPVATSSLMTAQAGAPCRPSG